MSLVQLKASKNRSRQRGNTILESAFVMTPFFVLLIGVVDFSTTIFLKSTLQNSVNQAVHFAATAQTLPGLCHEASIRKVLQDNSLGLLSKANEKLVSVNYYSLADLSRPISGPHGTDAGNVVEVSVANYAWSWLAPIGGSGNPALITVFAADRMEGRGDNSAKLCR